MNYSSFTDRDATLIRLEPMLLRRGVVMQRTSLCSYGAELSCSALALVRTLKRRFR